MSDHIHTDETGEFCFHCNQAFLVKKINEVKSQQERIAELESLLKEIIDKYIRWQPITDTTESHYQRQEILSKASRLLGEKDK